MAKKVARDSIENIIAGIPEAELRKLVTGLAEGDIDLRNKIVAEYATQITKGQLVQFKRQVDKVVKGSEDRHGLIGYREAKRFTPKMEELLRGQTEALISKKQYRDAIKMTCYIFRVLGEITIDDSNGDIQYLADICTEIWGKLLGCCAVEEKRELFQWFAEYPLKEFRMDYLQGYTDAMMMEGFPEKEFLEAKLQLVDARLATPPKKPDGHGGWYERSEFTHNVQRRIQLMKELQYTAKEIRRFRAGFLDLSDIRQDEIKDLLEEGETEKAILLLQKSKELDKDYAGLTYRYSEQLLALYKKGKRMKEYRKELEDCIFFLGHDDMKHIKALKDVCTEGEWQDYRKRLLGDDKHSFIHLPLMKAEGMYEELLNSIRFIGDLDEYESCLGKHFPELVRDMYLCYADEQAERACSRENYREVVKYLKKAVKYPDGTAKARAITDRWKTDYSRRPAFLDEIFRAGF